MKRLGLLILLTSLNLTVFSQSATDSVKCFDIKTLRLIAKDLVKGDSALALLKVADEEIWLLKRDREVQEMVITSYKEVEATLIEQVTQEVMKNLSLADELNEANKQLELQKKRNIKTGIGSAFLVAILAVLL